MTVAIINSRFPCVPRFSEALLDDISDDEIAFHADYDCSQGHFFSIPFSYTAVVPPIWECPDCETIALRV